MVEKISRALCIEESQDPDKMFGGGPGWKVYEHLALAAIKAMRTPTEAMLIAPKEYEEGSEIAGYDPIGYSESWPIMIDAALKEVEE